MPIRFSGQEATIRHAGVNITQVFHPLAPSESTNTKNALFSNTGPVIMMLTSSAASPASNQNVTFTATVIDPDVLSGTDDLTYVWTNNGTVVKTTPDSTSLTDTYSTSASGETRNIAVTVTDNEGESDSDSISQIWAVPLLSRNFSAGPPLSFDGGGRAGVGAPSVPASEVGFGNAIARVDCPGFFDITFFEGSGYVNFSGSDTTTDYSAPSGAGFSITRFVGNAGSGSVGWSIGSNATHLSGSGSATF